MITAVNLTQNRVYGPGDGGEGRGDGAGKEVRVLFQQLEAPEDGRELFGGV